MCHFVECFFDSLAAMKLSDSASFFLIKITKTILSDDPVIVRKIACLSRKGYDCSKIGFKLDRQTDGRTN